MGENTHETHRILLELKKAFYMCKAKVTFLLFMPILMGENTHETHRILLELKKAFHMCKAKVTFFWTNCQKSLPFA